MNWTEYYGPLGFFYLGFQYQTALSFLDKLWILGGNYYEEWEIDCKDMGYEAECYGYSVEWDLYLSSVLSSDLGSGWQEDWAPWPGRAFHTSVIFNNKMWVLGGMTGTANMPGVGYPEWEETSLLNDVWFSEDGKNWIQATASAPWAPRYGHASVVFDGKIWVLGGYIWEDGNSAKRKTLNDVWCSADGLNWSLVTEHAPWSPRAMHDCVVHNEKLFLIHNDVWVYEAVAEGEGEGEGEAETIYHSGDWHEKPDRRIDLTELLRIIQFYTSDGYSCAEPGDPLSDDGFLPGDGDRTCAPHAADYNPQDWRIGLSELLRIIQFYNSDGYHACEHGEDGFCPGK